MPAQRRSDAARRDGILCQLARQLPPEQGDSPLALARWLKEREKRGFAGLDSTIPENDERIAFEHWARNSSEANLGKRIQRAFRAEQAAKKAVKQEPAPASLPPPLVWPLGIRQRKEREPKFKMPWFLADNGGSERLFLECLGDESLHRVSVTLVEQRVGFSPALRPGSFIEIEWKRHDEVSRIATWAGWREGILAQERNKEALEAARYSQQKFKDSPVADLQSMLVGFAEQQVSSVEKVMPADLEAWKRTIHRFPLEVRYVTAGGAEGVLRGELHLDMERQWFLFKDPEGNATPLH